MLSALLATLFTASAQEFETIFDDTTLRIDYTFSGNADQQYVSLNALSKTEGWWGRRINLATNPLEGNGDLTLYDKESGAALYTTSFSSLFASITASFRPLYSRI